MLRQVTLWHNLSRRQFQLSTKSHQQNPPKPGRRYKSSAPPNSSQKKREAAQIPRSSDAAVTDKASSTTVVWYQRLGPVSRFITWFDRTQAKRPLVTQLCTSLCVYLAGDVLAQNIGEEPYDLMRTARHLTIGAIASMPGYHWYELLGNLPPRHQCLTRFPQVHVPRLSLQLRLACSKYTGKSGCPADNVYSHLQHLLLRHAVAAIWRWP